MGMKGELTPVPVDPGAAGTDFWKRFHELRRLRQSEARPEEPAEPDGVAEAQMRKENEFEFEHRYEISRDGVMLSWFQASTVKPSNPEYETNKHLIWFDAYVRPEQRRRGIGSLWLPVAAKLADRYGCSVVGTQTDQDSGKAFLSAIGADAKLSNLTSRMKVSAVDWAMLERWTAEGARRSPQTKLEVYDGGVPESMWPDFAPQFTSIFNTMPLEDLDLGEQIFTPERLRDWAERRELSGEVLYSVLTREPDGVISAVTELTWAPHRPRLMYQEFTGVRPEARGRGLGKWIKAAMLLHVRDLHPDLEWVITDNAQSNGPMLSINRALGFEQFRVEVEYQMSRADLEARLRSRAC
jgi:mycothiol synthase